jgi:predicted DNA binding CopG/RHH family protein
MDRAATDGRITDERIESLADYYDNTDLGETPWAEEVEIERPELEQISIRLPKEDLEFLKRRAAKLGVGYTTLLRMIVREHVRSSLRFGESG